MARESKARRAQEETPDLTPEQRAREVERMNHPNATESELDALQEKTRQHHENEMARAEQARRDRVALAEDPAATLPRLPVQVVPKDELNMTGFANPLPSDDAPVSVEQATQQLIEATQPGPVLTPAEYEAKRFETFKLDLYRVLYKHKYTLVANALAGAPGIGVVDAGNTSRMKRQLAQAGCVESLVNLTGKVEL